MEKDSLNSLEKELQNLKKEITVWQNYMKEYLNLISNEEVKWFSLNELMEYLPAKPSAATIYGWVSKKTIPYHKCGRRLSFLKSEIDEWVFKNGLDLEVDDEEQEGGDGDLTPVHSK